MLSYAQLETIYKFASYSQKDFSAGRIQKGMEEIINELFKEKRRRLLLCLAIAVPSWFLGQAVPVIGGPVFAILIGMVLTLILTKKEPFLPGVNYTSKKSCRRQSSSSASA